MSFHGVNMLQFMVISYKQSNVTLRALERAAAVVRIIACIIN
jgi:hypothetical protein